MNVSFNGCGTEVATFMTDGKYEKGTPVYSADNGKVSSKEGQGILGFVISSDDSYAAVCYRGIITVPCIGDTTPLGKNYINIGKGGKAVISDEGREVYIISADKEAGTITILL
jgi:hypothetical protein